MKRTEITPGLIVFALVVFYYLTANLVLAVRNPELTQMQIFFHPKEALLFQKIEKANK